MYSFFSKIFIKIVLFFQLKYLKNTLKKLGNKPIFLLGLSIRGNQFIEIGDDFQCGKRFRLDALHYLPNEPEILIGNNVNVNDDCHIACVNKLCLEDNVLIASKVYISDHSHGEIDFISLQTPPRKRPITSKGGVHIEKNVWVGEGVAILANVRIGQGSVIGANAVVTKDVPPFSVVVGAPAKVIKILSK